MALTSLAMLSLGIFPFSFVYDSVLPHHVPQGCACAPWASNASSAALWNSSLMFNYANSSCAMPANALTPDLALPIYSPSDGWCLCAARTQSWFTWCTPPPSFPSQLNLLLVNATAVGVSFVTADGGARAGQCGCEVSVPVLSSSNP